MIFKKAVVLIWAFMLATAAIACEDKQTRIKIEIDDDESGHQSFRFDSTDMGFDLQDLAVGETRVLTGESGNTAQVTRTEDGFEMEVNGETIDLGNLVDDADEFHMAAGERKKHKKVKMIRTDDENAVTIISGDAIDDATRARVREVLESAGHDGEVVFIDGNELTAGSAHSRHEVRIIKKEVDVTN